METISTRTRRRTLAPLPPRGSGPGSSMKYQIRPAPVTSYCHRSNVFPRYSLVASEPFRRCWRSECFAGSRVSWSYA